MMTAAKRNTVIEPRIITPLAAQQTTAEEGCGQRQVGNSIKGVGVGGTREESSHRVSLGREQKG